MSFLKLFEALNVGTALKIAESFVESTSNILGFASLFEKHNSASQRLCLCDLLASYFICLWPMHVLLLQHFKHCGMADLDELYKPLSQRAQLAGRCSSVGQHRLGKDVVSSFSLLILLI